MPVKVIFGDAGRCGDKDARPTLAYFFTPANWNHLAESQQP